MKKKITVLVLCSMLFGTIASAQGSIILTKDKEMLTYQGSEDGRYILAGYKDGVLKSSFVMENENGVFTAPNPGIEYDFRLCDVKNNKIYPATIQDSTPPPKTEEKDEQTYNPNNFPEETYDRAIDAYYAFSVVNKIAVVSSESGEISYEVEFANQGKIKKETIDKSVEIVSSPTAEPYLAGLDASSLKQGDVVYLSRMLNGEIESIGLIMRPPSGNNLSNSVSYGTNFENLISTQGAVAGYAPWSVASYGSNIPSGKGVTKYAFGICGYKEGNFLYLVNKSYNLDTALEIELKDKTAVYVCDKRSKVGGIEVESISAIDSYITKRKFLTGGVIPPNDEELTYALVRLVDGMATDIVCFEY